MPRTLTVLAPLALALAGCCLPEREALKPLAADRVFTYDELYARARAQSAAALEAFYADSWRELEDYAAGLEQTARLLPRTTAVPGPLRDRLEAETNGLRKDATALTEAARAQRVREANEAMQRIQLTIRQLRPGENLDAPPPKKPRPEGK